MVLVNRNVKVFMRDRAAVFFSMFSMLIMLALMVLFLGNMNSNTIVELLAEYGGKRDVEQDRANADNLVRLWTLAGILFVNCVTVTMTVMGNLVEDEEEGRLAVFYIAPVSRRRITISYILSAWIIGIGMNLVTMLAGAGLFRMEDGGLLAGDYVALFGMIVLNTFFYAAFAYLLALFIHSRGAWSSLLSVIGTLVGFAGAVYLPMGMLPAKIGSLLKVFPTLHGAAMMRHVCVGKAFEDTFAGMPEELAVQYSKSMGIDIYVRDKIFSVSSQIVYVISLSIVITVAAALISKVRSGRDR